jgi:hypothetical protein
MRGLGYFVINILGQSYGIKEEDATALACSYEEVLRRIHDRGKHTLPEKLMCYPPLIWQVWQKELYNTA